MGECNPERIDPLHLLTYSAVTGVPSLASLAVGYEIADYTDIADPAVVGLLSGLGAAVLAGWLYDRFSK